MANELIATTETPPTQDASGGATNIGNRFSHNADLQIDAIGYYRGEVGKTAVTRVDLWNGSTQTNVVNAAVTAELDDGSIGWHYIPIAPTTLTAAEQYVCSIAVAGGDGGRYWATAPPPPGAGYTVVGVRWSTGNGTGNFPGNVSSAELYGVSVAVLGSGNGGGGNGGATPEQVAAELAKWLSSQAATQEHEGDGLPWLTHQEVSRIGNVVGVRAVGGAGLWEMLRAVWNLAGVLTEAEFAIARRLLTQGKPVRPDVDPWTTQQQLESTLADLTAQIDGVQDSISAVSLLVQDQRGLTAIPGTGWALADETDFDSELAWPVAADAYHMSMLTWPPKVGQVEVAGVLWLPRLGWWAPLNGTFTGERRFLDWQHQWIEWSGRRIPGLLLQVPAGATGHVEAWRYGGV